MNYSKKKIGLLVLALLLLSTVVAVVLTIQTKPSIPSSEKKIHTGYASWPYHDLESATADAETIVCGKVISKGETKSHEIARSAASGRVFLVYYREVEVEVTQMVKGDQTAKTITYLEPGGETEDTIYMTSGVEPIIEGETYLFFLNEHGAFLSPATLMEVEDGTISPVPDMLPENELQVLSDEPVTVSLDDYLALVDALLA